MPSNDYKMRMEAIKKDFAARRKRADALGEIFNRLEEPVVASKAPAAKTGESGSWARKLGY